MPKNEIPQGRRPEEFLNDEQLVEFYRQQLDKADDKDKPKLAAAYRAAKIAAAITAAAAE